MVVPLNVINSVCCIGYTEPVTPRYRGNPPTVFRELNNTTPYKVRWLLVRPHSVEAGEFIWVYACMVLYVPLCCHKSLYCVCL